MSWVRSWVFPILVAVIGGGLSWMAFQFDAPVRAAVIEAQGPKWKKSSEKAFYSAVRRWGDWPPIMAGAALLVVACRARGRIRWSRIVLAAMLASTIAGALANASRLTTGRTRPRESPAITQGFYGPVQDGKLLIGVPAYNSFPSGHTATAFGFAAVLILTSTGWGMLALAGAGLVGWASIALGAHHPSDVMVSVTLSFLVAWGVVRVYPPDGSSTGIAALRCRLPGFRRNRP